MNDLPYLDAGFIAVVGLYGIATSKHLVHQVVCLSVLQSSTYVLLIAIGYRYGGVAPIFASMRPGSRTVVDPVVQALALTDIVVGAAVMALLFAVIIRVWRAKGTMDPDDLVARKE